MNDNGYCPFDQNGIKCTEGCEWYNHMSRRCIAHTMVHLFMDISSSLDDISETLNELSNKMRFYNE